MKEEKINYSVLTIEMLDKFIKEYNEELKKKPQFTVFALNQKAYDEFNKTMGIGIWGYLDKLDENDENEKL